MADPVTWTMMLLSGGETAFAYDNARRQGNAANDLAKHNARVLKQKGEEAARASKEEAKQKRFANREALASTRARIGAVESDDTTLGLLERQSVNAQLDNLMILREGQLSQSEFNQAADIEYFKGKQAQAAAKRKQIGILLSGAGKLAMGASSFSKPKPGGTGGGPFPGSSSGARNPSSRSIYQRSAPLT